MGKFMKLYFVLLMKSHLQSYPSPLQINFFWNPGFLLGVAIMLQIISGIFLALHYTSDLLSAYFSLFFLIREVYYGWCLRYLHSSGASFVFLFLFLHLGRGLWRILCSQSNIEDVLSLSFSTPFSSLWFWNS